MIFSDKTDTARMRTAVYTSFALMAFAANSVLCRLALDKTLIDAASFSTIRLVSGAMVLLLYGALRRKSAAAQRGSWTSAVMLFVYAAAFSFATSKR